MPPPHPNPADTLIVIWLEKTTGRGKSDLPLPDFGSKIKVYMPVDTYIARLKKCGHRVTPKVRAVVELFLKCGCLLDPLEVQARLKKQFKGVGLPTIYRILESLARCGILLPATNEDRQLRYFICHEIEAGHHHHFICKKCGKVEEVNLCLMEEVSKYVKRHLKAKVESHFLQIEGLCAKCS